MAQVKKNNPTQLLHDRTVSLLQKKHLAEAIDCMLQLAANNGRRDLTAGIELIRTNYALLLQYFKSGTNDPSRDEQLDALFSQAWNALDLFCYDLYSPEDAQLSDAITMQMLHSFEHSELIANERDVSLGNLFCQIKMSRPLSKEVRNAIHAFMLDEQLPVFERATILSAITLNLLRQYDADMLEKIYSYTLDDQPVQIRMQAYVALVLCGIAYDERIALEPRLRELYKMLTENDGDILDAIEVTIIFCKSAREFEQKITHVLKLEISNMQAGMPHMSFMDFLQLFKRGIDYEYNLFKKSFQKIPFFSASGNEHHWLMPFSLEYYKVKELAEVSPEALRFMRMIEGSVSQCNSSKYAQLAFVAKSFSTILSQISEQFKMLPVPDHDVVHSLDGYPVLRNYIHDLHRYLTINPEAEDLSHLLTDLIDFQSVNCLKEETKNTERLEHICRTLYKYREWPDAFRYLKKLTQTKVTPELLDMLVDAAEECEEFQTAEEALRRRMALFTNEDKDYLRLARCYHSDKALVAEESILHEALKLYPESETLLLQMGICLNSQNRANEAIPMLKHALQNSQEDKAEIHYEMAYANLLLKKGDLADTQIKTAIALKEQEAECLTMGVIISLHRGDTFEASRRYQQLVQLTKDVEQATRKINDKKELCELTDTNLSTVTIFHDLAKQEAPTPVK